MAIPGTARSRATAINANIFISFTLYSFNNFRQHDQYIYAPQQRAQESCHQAEYKHHPDTYHFFSFPLALVFFWQLGQVAIFRAPPYSHL
jgi:hypothetical protein